MHPHCHPITHGSRVAVDGRLRRNPNEDWENAVAYTQQVVGTPWRGDVALLARRRLTGRCSLTFSRLLVPRPSACCQPRQTHTVGEGHRCRWGARGFLRKESRLVCTSVRSRCESTAGANRSHKAAGSAPRAFSPMTESAARPCAEAPDGSKDS